MLHKFCSFSNVVIDDDSQGDHAVSRAAEMQKLSRMRMHGMRGMNIEVRYVEKARGAPLTTVRYLHTSH